MHETLPGRAHFHIERTSKESPGQPRQRVFGFTALKQEDKEQDGIAILHQLFTDNISARGIPNLFFAAVTLRDYTGTVRRAELPLEEWTHHPERNCQSASFGKFNGFRHSGQNAEAGSDRPGCGPQ